MQDPNEYVRETIDLVKSIENRFFELGARLHKIKEEKLWLGTYDSFHQFLDAAQINPGLASILASVYRNYVINNKIDPQSLRGIGYSNLYEAIPLIEQKGAAYAVSTAATLTRNEIKEAVRDKKYGEHNHELGPERWAKCTKCGKFVRVDA